LPAVRHAILELFARQTQRCPIAASGSATSIGLNKSAKVVIANSLLRGLCHAIQQLLLLLLKLVVARI
jgi:hypothetical protein